MSESPQLEDQILRAVTRDGDVAVKTVVATQVVRDATTRFPMSPTAIVALGRTLMGAVLLAIGQKSEETVQLQLRGDGPLGTVMAISDADARVRGTATNPTAHVPPKGDAIDVAGAIGEGNLVVVRHHPSWREPHSGIVRLQVGEVARDLAHYLTESEQAPSAVGLAVGLDRDGSVDSAAGFLVQALPGAADSAVARVESNVRNLPNVAELVRMGFDAGRLLDHLVEGVGTRERVAMEPRFYCPCDRERALRTVGMLPRDEIHEIIEAGEGQEVCCNFCGEAYQLSPADLRAHYLDD